MGNLEGTGRLHHRRRPGMGERTRSSSPARAPTSSRSTSARSSNPPTIRDRRPEDLATTVKLVESQGRRILARQADVRDPKRWMRLSPKVFSEFGRLDIVIANAGIIRVTDSDDRAPDFRDIVDVNLIGAWNTVDAAIPALIAGGRGGSIVLTSSTQGIKASGTDRPGCRLMPRPSAGWSRSMQGWASSACAAFDSGQHHSPQWRRHRHDHQRDHHGARRGRRIRGWPPSRTHCPLPCSSQRRSPSAVAWLVSDAARFITGTTWPLDAGFTVR